jgi:hypothetical protein
MAWDHRVSGLSKGDSELIGSEKNDEFQFKMPASPMDILNRFMMCGDL